MERDERTSEAPVASSEASDAGEALITPADLGDYAFAHDVRVAPDGARAFFEVTRVDMPANRYRTDIWCVGSASAETPGAPRQLTTSGEEGHYDLLDDGSVLFVSRRSRVTSDGKPAADAPAPGCDLYRVHPDGGEATLAVRLPGMAVRDWAQVDATRLVVCCRALADAASPVVEIEEVPFWENGGTFTAGTRWGLYLLDLARLPESCEARADGEAPVLVPLTRAGEDVDSWTLAARRTRVVFASRTYESLRPATNELWSVELPGADAPARSADEVARVRLGDAHLRRTSLVACGDDVLYLATDMLAHGVNQDPQPWRAPADGSVPERLACADAPDTYFGCNVGGDSCYGNGRDVAVAGGVALFLTTEFDQTLVRRLDVAPDGGAAGGMPVALDLSARGLWPQCVDTADGRTLWMTCASGAGLPEVWRAALPVDGALSTEVQLTRVTHLSDALAGKAVSAPEPFTFESGGDVLTGYVVHPAGYVPGRSYPGVLEIHGGPHCAYGANFSQEMQCLAAAGYFVFFTNPHGSAGHGVAFSDIRGRYGQQDYADLMALTDEVLRRFPDVDAGRLAVMGGSYGGFMTNWIIGHTDRFRCANSQRSIASFMSKALVSDIGTWANMPETTAHLGNPFDEEALAFAGDNPRKLWEQSPLAYAANVHTPTLFLHSECDYRCPLDEGMQMFTALKLRGVPSRLVIFKGESHGLCRMGKPQNRVRRLEEILAWYRRWL